MSMEVVGRSLKMKTHNRFGIEVEDVTDFQESGNFYSQAGQDLFVLKVLGNKINGTYVDIGCSQPREINNTFRLEQLEWFGINIDIRAFENHWKMFRKSPFIPCDATKCDYLELFSKYFNNISNIDYLSIDIDNLSAIVLNKIPFDKYRFNVITIEHDLYANGPTLKNIQHEILNRHKYVCMVENVMLNGNQYEDWWVSKEIHDKYNKKLFSVEGSDVLKFLDIG